MKVTHCRILSRSLLFTCLLLDFLAATDRVRAAQTPYEDNPWAVPGVIEVEHFDEGGEGVSFHDLTATNEGGAYRNTAVDIYASADASNGYYVLLRKGEWLEYTVSVGQTALYELSLRGKAVTTYLGAELRIFLDGLEVTSPISITDNLVVSWNDMLVPAVVLKAGQHILRLELTHEPADPFGFGTGLILDYLKFELSSVVPAQVISGSDQAGFADGPSGQARFSANITGMDIDQAGNIYVADAGNYRVRKINPAGEVTTLAGAGAAGTNDSASSQAFFDKLGGLVVDEAGACYVIDRSDLDGLNKIRKISLGGDVTTFYSRVRNRDPGDGGFVDFTGGIALNGSSDIFFIEYHFPFIQIRNERLARLTPLGIRTDVFTNYLAQLARTNLTALNSARSQYVYYVGVYSGGGGVARTDINSVDAAGKIASLYQETPGGRIEGLAADRSGNVYLAGYDTAAGFPNAVKRIEGLGRASAVHRGSGMSWALAADISGNIFAFQNNRLIKLLIGYRGLGLTLFTDGGGTVLADPPGFVFQTNQVVQITATSAAGWTFLGWTNDASGTQSNFTIVMTNHVSLEALFGAALGTPATNGTVRRDPDYALYPYGSWVQLTAQPNYGYEFVRWNDGLTSPGRTVEITNIVSLSPQFSAIPRYTLTAAALGGTGGTISRNPDQAEYFRDTIVTVTARPSSGYIFQVWLDNVLDNPRQITITSNTTLFAAFAPGQGTAPAITAAPRDTNVFLGGQAAFAVSAQGSTPLEYQWHHDGTNVSGATGPLLLLSNVQPSDAGVYTVTVANTVDTASAEARLNVMVSFSFGGVLFPAEGQIRFSIVGPPGTRYAIEQSEDLKYWQQVQQLDIVGGSVEFTDAVNPSYPSRFYRARLIVNP